VTIGDSGGFFLGLATLEYFHRKSSHENRPLAIFFPYSRHGQVATIKISMLVGGLEHGFYDFPYIGNFIMPTDELIFFRGVAQPPTRMNINGS